jgi:serine-type D-Ala-D-Ala carboxypeptidase (penicillin-binding protein 5/6)
MTRRGWVGLAMAVVILTIVQPADARRGRRVARRTPPQPMVPAARCAPGDAAGPYTSALLVDAETGRVLFEQDAFEARRPASMVKMMNALVTMEAIERGDIALDKPIVVSREASRTGGSGALLRAGEVLTLEDLFKAMMVVSSNGASVAIAEAVAGSTDAMVVRMNQRAREIGMTQTVYHTVNGLPPARNADWLPDMSSANDQAILARKLLEHPQILHYSAEPVVRFRNGRVVLRNTNHLVGRMEGVDGMKTGYYRLAGFNLTTTASRHGMRLVSVVMGCPTLRDRFRVSQQLLEWGFAHYSKVELVHAGEPLAVEIQVQNGTQPVLRPVAADGMSALVRNGDPTDLRLSFQVPSVVTAPVTKDQPLGEIIVRDARGVVDVIPAVSPTDVVTTPVRRGWFD